MLLGPVRHLVAPAAHWGHQQRHTEPVTTVSNFNYMNENNNVYFLSNVPLVNIFIIVNM